MLVDDNQTNTNNNVTNNSTDSSDKPTNKNLASAENKTANKKNTTSSTNSIDKDIEHQTKIEKALDVALFVKFTILFGIVATLQYFLNMLVGVWIIGKINIEYRHAIGSVVLSLGTLYGLLNFLRVSTVGFSAQAKYKNDDEKASTSFLEPAILSVVIGIVFVVLQRVLISGFIFTSRLDGELEIVARDFLHIVIWSAPVHLLNFTITGWLMGRGSTIKVLIIQMLSTAINIGLGIFLALNMELGGRGLAFAAIISQVFMCILGLIFIIRALPKHAISFATTIMADNRKKIAFIDSNLVLRFIFLMIQTQILNMLVASLGDLYIASSNMIMNFVFISYGMYEGIANAASAFAGRALAEDKTSLLKFTWKMTNIVTIIMSAAICVIYVIICVPFIEQIANNSSLQKLTIEYSMWLIPYFLIGGFSMSYLGIFLGAVYTKPLATSAFMSLVTFAFIYYGISDIVVKNGHSIFIAIWIAYTVFYIIRSLGLFMYREKLLTILDKR